MIYKDKQKTDNFFPFSPVSFYLRYLIHKNIIDIFDEELEEYNNLFIEFGEKCESHKEAMKVINYTITKIESLTIKDLYAYLKTALFNNLETYRRNG